MEIGWVMEFKELKKMIESLVGNKEYEKVKNIINESIEKAEIKDVEDEKKTHFCFNSYLELMLYVDKYQPNKPNVAPKVNMAYLYYILGFIDVENKDYDNALKNLRESLKWNPVDLTVLFENAEIYKSIGDLERFKAEIDKIYPLITSRWFLARYYREIGFYFIEKKVYDVANAIYSMALDFSFTEYEKNKSINELMYIAQQEKREPRKDKVEEIKTLCENYNVPTFYNKRTVGVILHEHKRLLERDGQSEQVKDLSRILFEITNEYKYMVTNIVKDDKTGISLLIPEKWGILRKSDYEKNGLDENIIFAMISEFSDNIFVAIEREECGIANFTEFCRESINNLKGNGAVVLADSSNRFDDGFKIRQLIIEIQEGVKVGKLSIVNGKVSLKNHKIRLIQNYVRVNDKLVCIYWEVPQDVEPKELLQILNNGEVMQMVLSIQGDNDKRSKNTYLSDAKVFVYNQKIWELNIEQLEEAKGLEYATQHEMQVRIDTAEQPYITPAFMEQLYKNKEIIKEIEKMIEWKKYLQDVNEVSITIGKDIYRIKNDVVIHFSNDNTMLEKRKIEIDEFKNIIYGLLPYLYDWEKSYLGQGLVEGANWSVLIKADNHEMKRFSGNNNYPTTWAHFCNLLVYAVERSDITFFDNICIKSLIYLVFAIEQEENQTLSSCLKYISSPNLENVISQLPEQHPARVLYKSLESLTSMQYAKLLIEVANMLSIFIEQYPEEDNKILFTISSEQDVDTLSAKIVEHYKSLFVKNDFNYEKMEAVAVCMSEEYQKNGINEAIFSYIDVFINNIIETIAEDRFWSDSAKQFLSLLVLVNLLQNKKVTIPELYKQTSDVELSKKMIKDNIEKIKNLSNANAYIGIIGLIDSDKPFESVVNITKEQLIKYLPQEKNQ